MWSSTAANAGARSLATRPPPVAKPRSPCTRCCPRVAMVRELFPASGRVERDEEGAARHDLSNAGRIVDDLKAL